MRRVCLSLLLVAGVCHADSSVRAPEAPARCRWEDTAYAHGLADPRVKQLGQTLHEPDVHFLQAGRNHYLFGDTWHPRGRMLALDAAGKPLMTLARGPAALVEDRTGTLAGLLLLKDKLTFIPREGSVVDLPVANDFHDSASVVLDGCTAYVGLYHRIATGSQLVAVDVCTGKLRWRADVEQMNVGHSEYYNDVTVSQRGSEIVLRGVEAAGCYEQSFDATTGRRLRSHFDRR